MALSHELSVDSRHECYGDIEGASDDFFLLSIFSQYGLLGALIFFGIWLLAIYYAISGLLRVTNLDDDERGALYFATGVLIILAVSMLHSGVLQRKVIYPYFPLVAGIVWRYVRLDKYKAMPCPMRKNRKSFV